MDGWITIGTELSTKTFDKKYEKLKNRLESAELNLKIKTDDLEDARNELKAVQRELTEINKKRNEINSEVNKYQKQYDDINNRILTGQGVTGEEYQRFGFLENKLTDLKSQQAQINSEFDKYNEKVNKATDTLSKAEIKYDIQKKKVEELRGEFQELVSEMQKSESFDFSGIKKNADNIGESIENIIKKVGRWALAVFGVRSAYMFVRQSISTLSQYNEQLATDIQYIRFALASTLEPIIKRLIELVYRLLQYVAYLAKAWFGINIFANATAKNFQKANKSLKSATKNASELKKQLAGFDEMNVLSDTSTGGVDAGGIDDSMLPSTDLSQWENMKVPKWLEWLGKNGKFIRKILEAIAVAIIAIKNGFGLLKGLGVFLFLDGVFNLIRDIKKYIDDPSWANLVNILADVSEILVGIGLIVGLTSPLGIALVVIGAIGLELAKIAPIILNIINLIKDPSWKKFDEILRSIIGFVVTKFLNSNQVTQFLMLLIGQTGILTNKTEELKASQERLKEAQDRLKASQDALKQAQDDYIYSVDNARVASERLKEITDKYHVSQEQLNEIVRIGDEDYQKLDTTQREIYKAYRDNKKAQDDLKTSTDKLSEATKQEKKDMLDIRLETMLGERQFDKYGKAIKKAMDDGTISSKEAQEKIKTAMSTMSASSKKAFVDELPANVKKGLDPKLYETSGRELTNWFDKLWNKISSGWDYVTKHFKISASGISFSSSGFAKGGIIYPKLPHLASGGIINRPGRGVPLSGAVGGERGIEGVVPLTDSQQMELLGSTIGKYITINATIPVYAYNRQVDRQIKRIKAEDDFAFNR